MAKRKLMIELSQCGKTITTPHMWVVMNGGAINHLSKETVDRLSFEPSLMGTFSHWVDSIETLEKYGKGLAEFCGYKNSPLMISPYDPVVSNREGYQGANTVSMWRYTNRHNVDGKTYSNAVFKAIKPDIAISLADGETPEGCSNKRLSKSTRKTLNFLDEMLEARNGLEDNSPLKNVMIMGSVEGGYSETTREYSAKQTASRAPVCGFLLDGFHSNGTESTAALNFDRVEGILKSQVFPHLPEQKIQMMQGSFKPDKILRLIEQGIDFFDSSIAYHCAERGLALCFPIEKNFKIKDSWVLNLKSDEFKSDMAFISEDSDNYVCRNYTRAYIHHLLSTGEMQGPLMLMMHNLEWMEKFFRRIRDILDQEDESEWEELKGLVQESTKCTKDFNDQNSSENGQSAGRKL